MNNEHIRQMAVEANPSCGSLTFIAIVKMAVADKAWRGDEAGYIDKDEPSEVDAKILARMEGEVVDGMRFHTPTAIVLRNHAGRQWFCVQDGRHRFAFYRNHGADRVAVSTDGPSLERMQEMGMEPEVIWNIRDGKRCRGCND